MKHEYLEILKELKEKTAQYNSLGIERRLNKIEKALNRLAKIDEILSKERLTKDISNKQYYCNFELVKCPYSSLYKGVKYKDIEDYVDCDLTLAVDKLGALEDIYYEVLE